MTFEYDVFMSHAEADKPIVRDLVSRLEADGIRVWIDEKEIRPGQLIGLEIEQALQKSRTVVLMLSEQTVNSGWVTLETHTAVFRDPVSTDRRFIPVRLDDADISDLLKQYAWVDWRQPSDSEYQKLLAAIRPDPQHGRADLANEIDPNWKRQLDRRDQAGAAVITVREMLKQGHPRCTCFCWYGGRHDGIDVFHDRLSDEFNDLTRHRCWTIRPEWPAVISRKSFHEMLAHSLSVTDASAIGLALRQRIQDRRRQILYVNHVPIESNEQLDPLQFLEYLRWWDEAVLGYLEPQQHVVLGVSFVVRDARRFREAIEVDAGIPSHHFSDSFVFEMLSVLQQLQSDHLRNFFKRINMQLRLDPRHLERAIQIILDSTGGEYDQVVRELEVLIADGFSKFEDNAVDRQRRAAEWGY
jgi:hypothetical protein